MLDMHMHEMQIAGMTLDEFLKTKRVSTTEAAVKLNRDATLISRYRKRLVTPSPQVIADIVEWSRGKVSPRELLAVSPDERGAA